MLRTVFVAFFFITLGRWCYSEIALVAPAFIPVVDFVATATTIPTHDRWPKDSVSKTLKILQASAQELNGVKQRIERATTNQTNTQRAELHKESNERY